MGHFDSLDPPHHSDLLPKNVIFVTNKYQCTHFVLDKKCSFILALEGVFLITYLTVKQSSSETNFQLILAWFSQREEKSSQIGCVSAYTDKYSTKGKGTFTSSKPMLTLENCVSRSYFPLI